MVAADPLIFFSPRSLSPRPSVYRIVPNRTYLSIYLSIYACVLAWSWDGLGLIDHGDGG